MNIACLLQTQLWLEDIQIGAVNGRGFFDLGDYIAPSRRNFDDLSADKVLHEVEVTLTGHLALKDKAFAAELPSLIAAALETDTPEAAIDEIFERATQVATRVADLDAAQASDLLSPVDEAVGSRPNPYGLSPNQIAAVISNLMDTGQVDWNAAMTAKPAPEKPTRENSGLLYKTTDGYTWDDGGIFLWQMHYDAAGNYVGQTQENMLNETGPLYFSASYDEDGNPCVDGRPVKPLSDDEIAAVEANEKREEPA